MKRLTGIAKSIKEESLFSLMFDSGFTIEEVKSEIVKTLEPFFRNKNELERIAIDYLVSDWIHLSRLRIRFPQIETRISSVLDYYHEAKIKNPKKVFSLISELISLHVEAGNRYWSFLNLEIDKSGLDLEEYVSASMRNLVDLIEGVSKSLLIENLAIDRIHRGKLVNVEKLIKLDLGVIVDELVNNSPFNLLFKFPPYDLRLSDWRNIGAHHGYKVKNQIILCDYGPAHKRKSVTLTRTELRDLIEMCVETLSILTISHKFFAFDNLIHLAKTITLQNIPDGRIEISFLPFASAVWSQGFEILDIKFESEGEAVMILKDLTLGDPIKRGIHSSQLIFQMWLLTGSKNLIIEYHRRNGELFFRSKSTSHNCDKFLKGELDIKQFANNVQFEFGEKLLR